MASKRCLPTRFFKDPDIMNLASRDSQLILVGLVLLADDEGRELAHAKLLSRELDYSPEQIEMALADLEANDLVVLYQGGKHRYYSLTRWRQWQTISRDKMTPSKCPAPPANEGRTPSGDTPEPSASSSQHSPALPTEPMGNAADSQHFPSQSNSSESNVSEGEGEEHAPSNVLPFPCSGTESPTTSTGRQKPGDRDHPPQAQRTAREVAAILHLRADDALLRIVQDYQQDPLLHLLGEADAAREYIDDPRRNQKGQRMTPAFFRRWLRREHEDAEFRQAQRRSTAATGTAGNGARAAPPPGSAGPVLPKSLMHLADQAGLGDSHVSILPHPKGESNQ